MTEFTIRLHKVAPVFTTFKFTVGKLQAVDFFMWYQERVLNTASSKLTFDLILSFRGSAARWAPWRAPCATPAGEHLAQGGVSTAWNRGPGHQNDADCSTRQGAVSQVSLRTHGLLTQTSKQGSCKSTIF